MKKLSKVLAVAALGMAAAGAQAQTASTSFQVLANVTAACTVAATDLDFGNYTATIGDVDNLSTITITCSSGTGWTLNIGSANNAARSMTGPGTLNYGLFNNTGRNVAFPTTTGSSLGVAQTVTVYGRIPGAQFVPVGNYSDTVNVSVTY